MDMPIRDETGRLKLSAEIFKVFREREEFVFAEDTLHLIPLADPGNVFTYWLVDGVPVMGEQEQEFPRRWR